jgi:hypothetical protein
VRLWDKTFNPLNAELNLICHLLALLGAHHIVHVSEIWDKVDLLTCCSRQGGVAAGLNQAALFVFVCVCVRACVSACVRVC